MKKTTTIFLLGCVMLSNFVFSQTTTFNYTGSVQTYTVPTGVTSIQIEANGAQGGGTYGGNGGKAIGTLPVTPGAVLQVYVGGKPTAQLGAGGFNGGGATLVLPCGGGDGWPGGGASDVRTTASLNDRIIVAGGGGGQGWSNGVGGAGGGTIGGDGAPSWITNTEGRGATQSAGGTGGVYSSGPNSPAPSGTFGIGGDSSPLGTYCTGGAGGGGWYGGGGGYVSAGGGGSSYISYPGTTNATTQAGVNSGNGSVIITVLCTNLNTSISSTTVCQGQAITLSASSSNGGVISWNNGVSNGIPFVPTAIGINSFTAISTNPADCSFSVDITVNPAPNVNAGVDITLCNDGTDTMLTVAGNADTYSWNNGITNGVSFIPTLGSTTYTVTGTNTSTGCVGSDNVTILVNPLPIVNTGTDLEICNNGTTITLSGSGNATTYLWDNGVTNNTAFVPVLGTTTYTVIGQDASTGCENSDAMNVTVNAVPSITLTSYDEILGNDGSVILTINSGSAPFNYDWNNDGIGDNDDNNDLTNVPGGTYTVILTDGNGCTATSSATVNSQVGINELNDIYNVFPNPTNGNLNIEVEGNFEYCISDILGKEIQSGKGMNHTNVNMLPYENGTYMITLRFQNKTKTLQIIKQ